MDLFCRSAALLLQKPGISKVDVYLQVRKRESREEPQTSKAEVCATPATPAPKESERQFSSWYPRSFPCTGGGYFPECRLFSTMGLTSGRTGPSGP